MVTTVQCHKVRSKSFAGGRAWCNLFKEVRERLIPGIPDEITTELIGPKLPWTAFHVLSRVNRGWRQAIQRHKFYDARVRSQSTQTLVALHVDHGPTQTVVNNITTISLYSVEDDICYRLPSIPGVVSGVPCWCECIFLDGKVYILGGVEDMLQPCHVTSAKVYMMDLAGQGQWKQCASMQDSRKSFGCDVMNGKIYVCGGFSKGKPVCGAEVYDPIEDVWSPIAPMISVGCHRKATTVGEELFVLNENCADCDTISPSTWTPDPIIGLPYSQTIQIRGNPVCDDILDAFAQVYSPLKNEWRIIKHSSQNTDTNMLALVALEGKLYKVTPFNIQVYDNHLDSWRPQQSCPLRISCEPRVNFFATVSVGDKIFATVTSFIRRAGYRIPDLRISIVQTSNQKLLCEEEQIAWQTAQGSLSLLRSWSSLMRGVHL